jgi:hypothetical protein
MKLSSPATAPGFGSTAASTTRHAVSAVQPDAEFAKEDREAGRRVCAQDVAAPRTMLARLTSSRRVITWG